MCMSDGLRDWGRNGKMERHVAGKREQQMFLLLRKSRNRSEFTVYYLELTYGSLNEKHAALSLKNMRCVYNWRTSDIF